MMLGPSNQQDTANAICIGLFQKISISILWTTPNWVPKNFRISNKDRCILCRIPYPADSTSWGIPEFWKILNGFSGIPIKIHKRLGKFMEFQSGSMSIYYRISNVVYGMCVWIFSGIAHYGCCHISTFSHYSCSMLLNRRLRKRWRTKCGLTFV